MILMTTKKRNVHDSQIAAASVATTTKGFGTDAPAAECKVIRISAGVDAASRRLGRKDYEFRRLPVHFRRHRHRSPDTLTFSLKGCPVDGPLGQLSQITEAEDVG